MSSMPYLRTRWMAIGVVACALSAAAMHPHAMAAPKARGCMAAADSDGVKGPRDTAVHLEEDEVAAWTATVLAGAYTLSPDHMPSNAAHGFTVHGWTAWQDMLERSGFLDEVRTNALSATASASGQATVVDRKGCDGHMTWTVHVPLAVAFNSEAMQMGQDLEVLATVVQGEDGGPGIDSFALQ